jgi:hypothetical protein
MFCKAFKLTFLAMFFVAGNLAAKDIISPEIFKEIAKDREISRMPLANFHYFPKGYARFVGRDERILFSSSCCLSSSKRTMYLDLGTFKSVGTRDIDLNDAKQQIAGYLRESELTEDELEELLIEHARLVTALEERSRQGEKDLQELYKTKQISIMDRTGLWFGQPDKDSFSQYVMISPAVDLKAHYPGLPELNNALRSASLDSKNTPIVQCGEKKFENGFSGTVSCGYDESTKKVKATVSIESYELDERIADSLQASNGELSLDYKNGRLSLINNSSNFITVGTISVYFQDEINSFPRLAMEIPPKGRKEITEIPSDSINRKVTRSLRSKAEIANQTATFGFAIKYDGGKKNSLVQVNKYYLLDAIKRSQKTARFTLGNFN